MPADRRALRRIISERRGGSAAAKRLIGFDFDCTLTVRHYFKCFAWGFAEGDVSAHDHCKGMADWCSAHDVVFGMKRRGGMTDEMVNAAVEDFCRSAGEEKFRSLFREYFLGGEERIKLVAGWLERMQNANVEFAIVTAGVSTSVVRALTTTPEWQPFFPSCRIWDTSQGRHRVASISAEKVLMLRDICPLAERTLFVDDSLCRDQPPAWVLSGAQVEAFDKLPYEGPGVSKASLAEIEGAILAGSSSKSTDEFE